MKAQAPLSLVVAIAENGVIGRGNQLPWRLPADLQHFKDLTLGHSLLMGRKTYDSIGRPLPGRRTVVLSHNPDLRIEGCIVVTSLREALALVSPDQELMVVGGADVYQLCLPHSRRIYLTRVHANVDGDTLFPAVDLQQWREVACEYHAADDRHAVAFSFTTLERLAGAVLPI